MFTYRGKESMGLCPVACSCASYQKKKKTPKIEILHAYSLITHPTTATVHIPLFRSNNEIFSWVGIGHSSLAMVPRITGVPAGLRPGRWGRHLVPGRTCAAPVTMATIISPEIRPIRSRSIVRTWWSIISIGMGRSEVRLTIL